MALTSLRSDAKPGRLLGPLYAWFGFIVMGAFWVCFAVFLASPPWAAGYWPLPTVDRGGLDLSPASSALTDLALISLFVMALMRQLSTSRWRSKS